MAAAIDVWMEGNKVVVHAEWRVPDDAGPLTDPTDVIFTARRADDASASYSYGVDAEVTKLSTGIFEFKYVPDPGVWRVHVQGTGNAHAADEVAFKIEKSGALA